VWEAGRAGETKGGGGGGGGEGGGTPPAGIESVAGLAEETPAEVLTGGARGC